MSDCFIQTKKIENGAVTHFLYKWDRKHHFALNIWAKLINFNENDNVNCNGTYRSTNLKQETQWYYPMTSCLKSLNKTISYILMI